MEHETDVVYGLYKAHFPTLSKSFVIMILQGQEHATYTKKFLKT